jgi:hypothetical protein
MGKNILCVHSTVDHGKQERICMHLWQDMASHLEAGDAQAVGRLALQAVEAMTSNLPTIKVQECI